eukprot:scaffold130520_cov45-Phaeocystis_antarctica.AAC.1
MAVGHTAPPAGIEWLPPSPPPVPPMPPMPLLPPPKMRAAARERGGAWVSALPRCAVRGRRGAELAPAAAGPRTRTPAARTSHPSHVAAPFSTRSTRWRSFWTGLTR